MTVGHQLSATSIQYAVYDQGEVAWYLSCNAFHEQCCLTEPGVQYNCSWTQSMSVSLSNRACATQMADGRLCMRDEVWHARARSSARGPGQGVLHALWCP